jgi:hypothetical protein
MSSEPTTANSRARREALNNMLGVEQGTATHPTTPEAWLKASATELAAFQTADPDGYARLRDIAIERAASRR